MPPTFPPCSFPFPVFFFLFPLFRLSRSDICSSHVFMAEDILYVSLYRHKLFEISCIVITTGSHPQGLAEEASSVTIGLTAPTYIPKITHVHFQCGWSHYKLPPFYPRVLARVPQLV